MALRCLKVKCLVSTCRKRQAMLPKDHPGHLRHSYGTSICGTGHATDTRLVEKQIIPRAPKMSLIAFDWERLQSGGKQDFKENSLVTQHRALRHKNCVPLWRCLCLFIGFRQLFIQAMSGGMNPVSNWISIFFFFSHFFPLKFSVPVWFRALNPFIFTITSKSKLLWCSKNIYFRNTSLETCKKSALGTKNSRFVNSTLLI